MSERPTLALAMIVRDEEKTLARCLDSVVGVVDEIVIVDTGSNDRTLEIIASYADKVPRLTLLEFEWCDDFSAARNHGLDHVVSDWALHLDADEELALPRNTDVRGASGSKRLRKAIDGCLSDSKAVTISVPLDNAEGPGREHRIIGSGIALRLLRPNAGVRYHKSIHEQPLVDGARTQSCAAVRIIHFGPFLLSAERLLEKHERNTRLLESALRKNGTDVELRKMLGHELMWQGRVAEARDTYAAITRLRSPWSTDEALYPVTELYLSLCDALLGRTGAAISRLEELSGNHPRFTDALFLSGELHAMQGELRVASEIFSDCLRAGDTQLGYESWGGSGSWRPMSARDHLVDYLRDASNLPPQSVIGYFARRLSHDS